MFLLSISLNTHAQGQHTISGYVKDAKSGESLIGAVIGLKGTTKGTNANQYGFYSITTTKDSCEVVISFIGYQTLDTLLHLSADLRLNINLDPATKQMQEVVVTSDRKDDNVQSSTMGRSSLSIDQIKTLPVLFGEVDILKILQLLPGVQFGGEGSTGLYVRGGSPDQNLVLLDNAVVYNTGHLLGFFSIFNSDAILNTTLYKEGMPAEYGGRLSSVVDVDMREGNDQEFHGSGGIGLIASRLMLEGPIIKHKCSFMVSGRRTYIDVITKPLINTSSPFYGSGYYFYDFNAKINYNFNDNNHLYLSAYYGRDVFNYDNSGLQIATPWGNTIVSLRWNHLFNSKLFMNVSAIYNNYNFSIQAIQNNFELELYSGIYDYNGKVDFSWFPGGKHEIKFGVEGIYHTFTPSTISGRSDTVSFNPAGIVNKYGYEEGVYFQDKYTLSQRIEINAGLRISGFQQVGPYDQVQYGFNGVPNGAITYAQGQLMQAYYGLEPRLLARYTLNNKSSIKAAFTKTNQYIHLVSNSQTSLPTDIWVPSTTLVKPQVGYQYSAGYFRNFLNNLFETSVEVYYKQLQNEIDYSQSYVPQANEDLQDAFVFGKGWSYGLELYINKKYGKFTGWIGYTLSYTNLNFPDLNYGQTFPAEYDRRHDLSVVASYNLNKHWSFSSTFVFATGIAITPLIGRYFIEENVTDEYGAVDSYRLPPYDRLDVSATYMGKQHKHFQMGWTFSIYNVYNRQNPYFIYYETTGDLINGITSVAKAVTIFPILPSITWNFKF